MKAAIRLQLRASALILVGLVGCSSLAKLGVGVTPIKHVKEEWHRYSTVYIRGAVGNQVQLLGTWVYEVQDPTGTIWVLTAQPVPHLGDQIWIEGKVRYQAIAIKGQELGEAYLIEKVRLEIDPSQATAAQ